MAPKIKTLTLDPTEIKTRAGRKSEGPDYSPEIEEAMADRLIHALPVDDQKDGQRHGRYLRNAASQFGVKLRVRTFEHFQHGWVVSYVVKPEAEPADDAE